MVVSARASASHRDARRRPLGRLSRLVREVVTGAALVPRGFALWRRRPAVMALGMVPAFIAAALIAAVLIGLGLSVDALATAVTPFAESWAERDRTVMRTLLALVIVAGAIIGTMYIFTTLTLLIGDPFYERIWRAAERELGDFTPSPVRFWRSFGDALLLVLRAMGFALITGIVGLIPVVGSVTAAVLGPVLAGHLIARELTTRAFEARGITAADRARLLRGSRARELGFGVATQLFFLIPGGAIAVMPAAVVGATHLARSVLERAAAAAGETGVEKTP
ncbi:EI24 domain-containing protein [Microcella sp.]|uniref:EI24 domain-containing protein n=1 Tax=Microcella sp. TaxID=1913979 RepID=UPI00299F6968|nr:EI24 domain-containing protein [Microcella sp.]MDX2025659.1 EI24 domain-containing protein [Microcella sp.]